MSVPLLIFILRLLWFRQVSLFDCSCAPKIAGNFCREDHVYRLVAEVGKHIEKNLRSLLLEKCPGKARLERLSCEGRTNPVGMESFMASVSELWGLV